MTERNEKAIDGVEILIVTFATPTLRVSGKVVSDFDWLVWCLRAARKYLSGFQGITIGHPNHESDRFKRLLDQFDVKLHGYDEVEGKGFIQHEVMMASADTFLPPSTKFVCHLDSDCIYKMPTDPQDYFLNDKPVYLYRTWESLTTEDPNNPGSKCISDCAQWKLPTDAQLGFDSAVYTMTRHPTVLPIDFYQPYRDHVSSVHKQPFRDWMLAGTRNAHPQDRMDHTAMGAYAWRFMRNRFHWINCATEPYPADRQKCFWSHSGVTVEVQREIESFL